MVNELCTKAFDNPKDSFSGYIAPWALPKENIPIHMKWDDSFKYDTIKVIIPSDISLKEFFNVEKVTIQKDHFIISKLKTHNFFGFTIASSGIPDKAHIQRKITSQFFLNGKQVLSKEFIANIYRPFVTFFEAPKIINITEDVKEPPQVTLKLSGFGKIQIKNEAKKGGVFVPRIDPLYESIIKRMIYTFNDADEEPSIKRDITIDQKFLRETATEFIERVKKGDVPRGADQEAMKLFEEFVSDENNKGKLMTLMSRNIEDKIIEALIFYFEKFPEENVTMPQGNPVMIIDRAQNKINLRFIFTDSMMNEYEPIEAEIQVNDLRKSREPIEIPIKIKWIFEPINPSVECE